MIRLLAFGQVPFVLLVPPQWLRVDDGGLSTIGSHSASVKSW
jgi:hypothetical protein